MQDKINAHAYKIKYYRRIDAKYNDLMKKYENAKDKHVQLMIDHDEVEKNFSILIYKLWIMERKEHKKSYEEQRNRSRYKERLPKDYCNKVFNLVKPILNRERKLKNYG